VTTRRLRTTPADGEYAGFDEREPTSETGGKARAIEGIRQQHGFSSVVMVGDGVTDLEAKGPADMVIGFGGNVVRRRSTCSMWTVMCVRVSVC
jgi:phosphoserine phosphatase